MSVDAGITFFRVADIERSHVFYQQSLGLELVLDQGGCRIYRLTDSSFLGVCERDEHPPSNVITTIVTGDVDGWHRRFVDAGSEVDGEPRDNDDYRIYHFFGTDPDGHLLEVQRFWDSDWSKPLG